MSYRLDTINAAGVPPLLEGIEDAQGWAAKREAIEQVWREYVGPVPQGRQPEWQVNAEAEEADHIRLHLTYRSADGDLVPAYLLVPRGALTAPPKSYPAMLALHPTAPAGKDDVATPKGRLNRTYGLELVHSGYVVLAPDTITAGERIYDGYEAYRTKPFYDANPGMTAVGKMAADHKAGLDLLEALPYVDAGRIGAIGHSLGGYNAFFLAGLDARVKAIVCSCGLSVFAGDPDPNRWGQRDWFSHIPRISDDLAQGSVPFELHEVAALAAPTPFFVWNGLQDRIFPNSGRIAEAVSDLAGLYERLGAGDRFIGLLGAVGHDFPDYARACAYAFLDRFLQTDDAV